ncbi:MAG: polysaccharide lyase 6 family protein [Gammaproteobacteria bacterium]|nr:polysaccharide lyase 6 family protein [Gammaproteobacteria bacterium]MCY4340236.1 polysaccharide lyase 6 family protein [Gammaproteobacteria bacterium]
MKKLIAVCGLLAFGGISAETLEWDASPYSQDATPCDLAAAHPLDPNKAAPGVSRAEMSFPAAIAACEAAVAEDPGNPRLRYQLARVYTYSGQTGKGWPHMEAAVAAEYPQALFVSGYMQYLGYANTGEDVCGAGRLIRRSAEYGRLAAQVGFVRYALDGGFDRCEGLVEPAEMLDFLAAAADSTNDYYPTMLIGMLRKEIDSRARGRPALREDGISSAPALFAAGRASASETLVTNQEEYRAAVERASPGDTIVLSNGIWRDFEILLAGNGEPERPITLTAETKGRVVISGQSNLRLAGSHLVVSGLVFRDGYSPTNTVISFRRAKGEPANYSRVTETVIDRFNNPERHEIDFWVLMFGRHNRFDHNHLEGKGNLGVTMAVRLDGEENQRNRHRIDHNYFGPRPILGANGGETLRIGTSHYSLADSLTVVENNVFDRCDGELEIISNKSGGNIFRGNLFLESRGTLTMRHGNNAVVEDNVFFGNGVPNTGGIRIINKGHVVRNNYLYGLAGYRFGAALTVMNGVPDSPLNRYHQVEDVVMENNSIIQCDYIELAGGSDEERSAPPIGSIFRSNLVFSRAGENIFRAHDDISGIAFAGNVANAVADLPVKSGFSTAPIEMQQAANGLWYPVGDELASIGVRADLQVLDMDDTGVAWYPKPEGKGMPPSGDAGAPRRQTPRSQASATIPVAPGENALFEAAGRAEAGSILELAPGAYRVRKTIVVDRPLGVRAVEGRGTVRLEFERSALFELEEGGRLELSGLEISGAASPDMSGNAVVRTSRYSMTGNYGLVVEDCSVSDLDVNDSFNFLSVSKGTFADEIRIARSEFSDITGSVIALSRETDDLGRYNGEVISVVESRFSNIGGAVADIYRGGTDESTFGPRLEVRSSVLDSVGRNARNKTAASIRLLGVQVADIHGNEFIDSRPIRVTHTVGDPITRIRGNRFAGTPEPIISKVGRP